MRNAVVRFDPYLILLFGLSSLALAPLFAPGYFYSAHDGRHSVFFVAMFDEAIQSGALWPRWAMHHNQGYGYPTFVVQAPLAFYAAEAFILLGAGITQAVKLTWAVSVLGGAWGIFALVRHWLVAPFGAQVSPGQTDPARNARIATASGCALVAALMYTYAPYHLLDVYVRAALAETFLMVWFPWVFLAFDRLILWGAAPGWQGRAAVAALSYAALLLTHSFAFVAFTPLLVAFVLFRLAMTWRGKPASEANTSGWKSFYPRIALAAGAGVAAVLLAAIYLFPLFAEGPLLVQEEWTRDTYDYTRHWVHWGQFFSPFWGFGYSDDPIGANDGMGFQLGVMLVLPALVAGYRLITARRLRNVERLMQFLLAASVSVLALMTPGAEGLWRTVPLLAVIQFPWRLLSLAAFTLSVLGGLVVWHLLQDDHMERPDRNHDSYVLVFAVLVCFAGFIYARPSALLPVEAWREDGRAVFQFEQEHPDMIATTQFVEQPITDSPMTEQYLAADFSNDALPRLGILAGQGEVIRSYSGGHAFGGEVDLASPATVQVRLYAFPGWQVRVDGQPVEYRVSPPHGLMEVDLPPGRHQIDVWMGATPAMRAGGTISLLTLLVLAGLWLSGQRLRRTRREVANRR